MVQPTTDPGTISVPMSSIVDALKNTLKGVLTEEEQSTLFDQLGLSPGLVAPGDLISADLFNKMLSDINNLSIRLAALEGVAGGPILDRILPEGTAIAVNSLMTVIGRNFDHEPRRNIVHIGGVKITQFREESTATTLYFPVPDLFSNLPANFPVSVETAGRLSNVISVALKSAQQVQQGHFTVQPLSQPSGNVTAGATLIFSWMVKAITLLDDELTLSLLVTEAVPAATAVAWQSSVSIQASVPLQSGTKLSIKPGETPTVTLTVAVPAGATSAKLALRGVAKDGVLVATSDPIAVAVGAPIEASDPRIELGFTLPSIGGGKVLKGAVTIEGLTQEGLWVKKGQSGAVNFTATDKRLPGAGVPNVDFTFAVAIEAPANGLSVSQLNPTSAAGVAAANQRPFDLTLSATAGAATGATARLKVTCQQTKATGGLSAYKSYRTIPLKVID